MRSMTRRMIGIKKAGQIGSTMDRYKEEIDRKYQFIARIPEHMFSFTAGIRKEAIGHLHLAQGSSVIDVGCGTGASFPYLEAVIGESGTIVGVEPSRSMMSKAWERVKRAGWKNITLIESTIEEVEEVGEFDSALLFAMHDVFNSVQGLEKIHALVSDGGRIVCVGPKLQDKGVLRVLNPGLNLLFKRMAISQDNKEKPWRLAAERFITETIIEEKHGLIFIFVGRKSR
jgi:ubiquinone/menaquinone biosynthesis C-methylase UbiE